MNFSDQHISAFLDGELSADQLAEFERAMVDDLELRDVVEETRLLRDELRNMPRFSLGEDFASRVTQQAKSSLSIVDRGTNTLSATAQGGNTARPWKRIGVVIAALAGLLLVMLVSPRNNHNNVAKVEPTTSNDSPNADTGAAESAVASDDMAVSEENVYEEPLEMATEQRQAAAKEPFGGAASDALSELGAGGAAPLDEAPAAGNLARRTVAATEKMLKDVERKNRGERLQGAFAADAAASRQQLAKKAAGLAQEGIEATNELIAEPRLAKALPQPAAPSPMRDAVTPPAVADEAELSTRLPSADPKTMPLDAPAIASLGRADNDVLSKDAKLDLAPQTRTVTVAVVDPSTFRKFLNEFEGVEWVTASRRSRDSFDLPLGDTEALDEGWTVEGTREDVQKLLAQIDQSKEWNIVSKRRTQEEQLADPLAGRAKNKPAAVEPTAESLPAASVSAANEPADKDEPTEKEEAHTASDGVAGKPQQQRQLQPPANKSTVRVSFRLTKP